MVTVPRSADNPWDDCAIPLTCLVFVSPLILIYELGVLCLGVDATRNGCDLWLRALLQATGFGQYFLLPLLTLFLLVGWHHLARLPWQIRPESLVRMGWESLSYAAALLLLSQLQGWLVNVLLADTSAAAEPLSLGPIPQLIAFFGAGIYEELLFRVALIPALIIFLRWLGEGPESSIWTAAVASSALFAAAHYEAFVGAGDSFAWSTFMFRFVAGLIFAVLFLRRGFGITAGAHVMYDILAGIVFLPIR